MTSPTRPLVLRSSADLIAVTPYLFGFHPADSLVVIGMSGGRLTFGARHDLPPPPPGELAPLIVGQSIDSVSLLGFGPPEAITPAALPLAAVLQASGLRVNDVLRITGDRWWSYLCSGEACCPPDGHPCRPAASEVAAEAIFQGRVALPNRQALVARVAPVEGPAREAMRAATGRAEIRMADLRGEDVRVRRSGGLVRRTGRAAVRDAERWFRAGRALSDGQVAWLGVLLVDPVVHDYALDRSGAEEWRIGLWTEVVRRVEPAYAVSPACLLGYAAWQAGDGPLARVAIDRALIEAPGHRAAGVLDELLCSATGPRAAGIWPGQAPTGGERRQPRGTRRRS